MQSSSHPPEFTPFSSPSRFKPYLVGAGIGVLSWLAFAIVAQPLGITTALSEVSGAVTGLITGSDFVKTNSYWAKTVPAAPAATVFPAACNWPFPAGHSWR